MGYNKKEVIEDIAYQLQQIDYTLLLNLIKPIVISYIGNKVIDFALTNYKLKKDYKPKSIGYMQTAPEIDTSFSNYDTSELLKKQFGQYVIYFVETIIDKIPNADFKLLHNNLKDFQITFNNFKFENFLLNKHTVGAYFVTENKIRIQNLDFNRHIYHELFHMANSFYRKEDGIIFSGFSQNFLQRKENIGDGLNEGYTELLAQRYFSNKEEASKAYRTEVHYAHKLEMIVGKDRMEQLYLKADFLGLVQELKQYETEEKIMEFMAGMDFINKYLRKKKNFPIQQSMLKTKLIQINQFLIMCYTKKMEKELMDKSITFDELKEKLSTYISMLGVTITANNKRKSEVFNIQSLTSALKISSNDFINLNIVSKESPKAK